MDKVDYEENNVSESGSVVGDDDSSFSIHDDIEGGGDDSDMDDYDSMDEEDPEKDLNKTTEVGVEENLYDSSSSDEEDDEEEDDNEDHLQKLDDHFRQKVIEDHHPELKILNYEEIETLTTVVRDADSTIIDALHRTLPVLTRYEKARILGERAKQINMGGKPFVEIDESMMDGYLIALKELEQKVIPFIIQRPLPNGGSEYWRVSDLEVLA